MKNRRNDISLNTDKWRGKILLHPHGITEVDLLAMVDAAGLNHELNATVFESLAIVKRGQNMIYKAFASHDGNEWLIYGLRTSVYGMVVGEAWMTYMAYQVLNMVARQFLESPFGLAVKHFTETPQGDSADNGLTQGLLIPEVVLDTHRTHEGIGRWLARAGFSKAAELWNTRIIKTAFEKHSRSEVLSLFGLMAFPLEYISYYSDKQASRRHYFDFRTIDFTQNELETAFPSLLLVHFGFLEMYLVKEISILLAYKLSVLYEDSHYRTFIDKFIREV